MRRRPETTRNSGVALLATAIHGEPLCLTASSRTVGVPELIPTRNRSCWSPSPSQFKVSVSPAIRASRPGIGLYSPNVQDKGSAAEGRAKNAAAAAAVPHRNNVFAFDLIGILRPAALRRPVLWIPAGPSKPAWAPPGAGGHAAPPTADGPKLSRNSARRNEFREAAWASIPAGDPHPKLRQTSADRLSS